MSKPEILRTCTRGRQKGVSQIGRNRSKSEYSRKQGNYRKSEQSGCHRRSSAKGVRSLFFRFRDPPGGSEANFLEFCFGRIPSGNFHAKATSKKSRPPSGNFRPNTPPPNFREVPPAAFPVTRLAGRSSFYHPRGITLPDALRGNLPLRGVLRGLCGDVFEGSAGLCGVPRHFFSQGACDPWELLEPL